MKRVVAALVVTIALGLISRLCPIGWPLYDKSLGDILYAVAAYLALRIVLIRKPAIMIAPLAVGLCVGIECFKLTGIPVDLARDYPIVGWVLGSTFSWHNLACYAVGVAIIATIDSGLLRTQRGSPRLP